MIISHKAKHNQGPFILSDPSLQSANLRMDTLLSLGLYNFPKAVTFCDKDVDKEIYPS
jgi:hypothetical protein